jgi:hypothetical protein
MKRLILGACAALMLAGMAFAQTTTPTPPPPPGVQIDEQDSPDGAPPDQGKGWRKHGRHGGMGQMRGMMKGKGFGIMAGPGHGLHVSCGEEPIKDCIAAAQPLIDAFNKAEVSTPKAQ